MTKVFVFWAAILVLPMGATAEELLGSGRCDISLDEVGRVTEVLCVDATHPVLIDPLQGWVLQQTFEPAVANGQPAPSTTSAHISYALVDAEDGYALVVRHYDNGPRVIEVVSPQYPGSAARTGREGWVRIQLTVDATGTVSNPTVMESSHKTFERAAMKAIRHWRFKPETVNGVAVSTEVTQTIEFAQRK